MVEIFKTNIDCECVAQKVERIVKEKFQNLRINFDLEDCDKILRIEADNILVSEIRETIQNMGLKCEAIE